MSKVRFVGLDVHADTIAVAVAEAGGGEVRSLGIIPNRLESIRKMIGKLAPLGTLRCCYEAVPTGYVLYWQLTKSIFRRIGPASPAIPAAGRLRTESRRFVALCMSRAVSQFEFQTGGCENKFPSSAEEGWTRH